MLTGLKIEKNKGMTNLTGVHPFISKIAIDSGYIEQILKAYGFPDAEFYADEINIGYATIQIPREFEIYGEKVKIDSNHDLLYLSHLPDIYDVAQNFVRRRIYHANIQPFYHGFMAGYGNTIVFWNFSEKTKRAYMLMIAFTNHYYQDAFAPMHISLKDQDIHIQFEKDFDDFLKENWKMIEGEVIDMLNRRGMIDTSKYKNVNALAMKYVSSYMSERDRIVAQYRAGDRSFEGIEHFLYGAVLATIGHTADMVSKEILWRDAP